MYISILNAIAVDAGTIGGYAFIVGLGIVFIVLVLLIFSIGILSLLAKKREPKSPVIEPALDIKPDIIIDTKDDEDEIIAIITAAIACMAQSSGKQFAIKSYKRVGTKVPAWYLAGQNDVINSRY